MPDVSNRSSGADFHANEIDVDVNVMCVVGARY